jgi:predicted nucleotide-binding protein with TIR-like domain
MSKPVVFVGSSSERLPLVTELVLALEDKAVVKEWKRAFSPGEMTLNALMARANEADFAVFIFGPDDWTESRSVGYESPRDNVVFEAGLFGAVLGWSRCIIVHAKGVKLPSDLEGLTLVRYDTSEAIERQAQLVGARLGTVIDKLGWRGSESLAGQIQGHWWQLTLNDAVKIERSALALVEIRRVGTELRLEGTTWTAEGKPIAQFWSKAASTREEERTLFYWWEGEWPGEADTPQLFGKGQIKLTSPNEAMGSFTIRADDDRDPRERKSAVYRRATAEEVHAVKELDSSAREEVIQRLLKRREEVLFSGGVRDSAAAARGR